MPLTPKNRKEEWLQGLVDHETTLTPKNRPEKWMKEIIDASGSGGGGGTGGGVLVVGIDMQTMTLDKTWQEIYDASCAVLHTPTNPSTGSSERYYLADIGTGENAYVLKFTKFSDETLSFLHFAASAPSEYPVYDA